MGPMNDRYTRGDEDRRKEIPTKPVRHEAAAPWEPLKLDKHSGVHEIPWQWWDGGQDGRDL